MEQLNQNPFSLVKIIIKCVYDIERHGNLHEASSI